MENFDEYLRQGEPGKTEKAKVWKTAIGLQQVDGLKPSDYLIATARKNIEGDITIEEVKQRIDSYYQQYPIKNDENHSLKNREMHIQYIPSASEISEKGSEKGSEKTKKSSEKILGIIKYNAQITIKELAEQLKVSTRAIEKNISKLKSEGKLERIGGDKGGHWKIIN